jgi:hypothetical protein
MILFWNNATSFNRHLENMRRFRQWHRANEKRDGYLIKDMPMTRDIHVSLNAGGAHRFFGSSTREIVVPIWKIALPESIQN